MHTGFFVTGTDTGIGKTVISCLLLEAFAAQGKAVVGMKPIASGSEQGKWHDVEFLCAASNVAAPREHVNPYAMHPPIAPHIAAGQAGVAIELPQLKQAYDALAASADVVIVEGVGGFCVPVNAHQTTADLAKLLGLPVILVVGMRLGCINHAMLTVQAIEQAGLCIAGWVANCVEPEMAVLDETVDALQQRIDAPLLGKVPFAAVPEITQVTQLTHCLDMQRLLQFIEQE